MTSFHVTERTVAQYSGKLVDEKGIGVSSAALLTFTLSLYDRRSSSFINSRQQQSVLNTNNVTVDTLGNVLWQIQPEDNVILDDTLLTETHVALFEAIWSGGRAEHEVELVVRNIGTVI